MSSASLATVQRVAEKAAANVRSIGVALAPCILFAAGAPSFELPAGQMEIGMGIHREPGVRRGPLETADQIAEQLTTAVLDDLLFTSADDVAVLVNGPGATPKEELYILYRGVNLILQKQGIPYFLSRLLARQVPDAVVAGQCDAEAYQACADAGAGATLTLSWAASSTPRTGRR